MADLEKKTALQRLFDMYESKVKCAEALSDDEITITPQILNGWKEQGYIPYRHGKRIEEKTKRKIKAVDVWQDAGKRTA